MDLNIATALWFASEAHATYCVPSSSLNASPAEPDGVVPTLHSVFQHGNKRARTATRTSTDTHTSRFLDHPLHAPFAPLCDAVEMEIRSGTGSDGLKVRLSSLGKEYRSLLDPESYKTTLGYRRLIDYARGAEKCGLLRVGFDAQGPYLLPLFKVEAHAPKTHTHPGALLEALSPSSTRVLVAKARLVMSGLGADETLGGYARYRTAFQKGSWKWLTVEMEKDFVRLWKRNLGRDDRVVSDHGREVRYPYLDEAVLLALKEIPVEHVLDLHQPLGVGDKYLLRVCAKVLGLRESAELVKRAIQFGTRIADRKVRGSDDISVLKPNS